MVRLLPVLYTSKLLSVNLPASGVHPQLSVHRNAHTFCRTRSYALPFYIQRTVQCRLTPPPQGWKGAGSTEGGRASGRGDGPDCEPGKYCFFPRCQMAEVYLMNKAIEELIYCCSDFFPRVFTSETYIQVLPMGPCLTICYILLCPSLSHMKFRAGLTLS